jgi:hypothetical protein
VPPPGWGWLLGLDGRPQGWGWLLGLDGRPQGWGWFDEGETPTGVGNHAVLGETPTEVGRCLRSSWRRAASIRGKNPHEVGCALRPQSERETPTGVGRSLRALSGALLGAVAVLEKNPHQSGEVLASIKLPCRDSYRVGETPTEVGSTTVTTSCQCATPSIAHNHQPGHPIKNSLRDPL